MFSAFPDGWPGIGLLLLRGFVSFTLIVQSIATVSTTARPGFLTWFVAALAILSACCLLVGFMTPVAGVVIGIGVLVCALFGIPSRVQFAANYPIELVVLAIAIVLIGPGAFSVDARMFGRREIRIGATHHSPRT